MVNRRSKKIWNLRNVIKIGIGTRADVRDDYTETINNHDRIMGTEDLTKLIKFFAKS